MADSYFDYILSKGKRVPIGQVCQRYATRTQFIKSVAEDWGEYIGITSDSGFFYAVEDIYRQEEIIRYEFLPANYDEWLSAIKVLLKDRTYRNKLTYYIRLNTLLPYKDQLALTRRISSETSWLLRNAQYDKKYMLSEGKEAVLSLPQRIIGKSENPDFIMEDGTKCIFL